MDGVLCDVLLQEIFQRLPSSSAACVSLVSKRWLFLLRSSTTQLSLHIPSSSTFSVSAFLSQFPCLSTLTVVSDDSDASSDSLLLAVATSPCSRRLAHLRLLFVPPLSPSALFLVSSSFAHLTVLHLSSVFPFSFRWVARFPSLKTLSLVQSLQHKLPAEDDGRNHPFRYFDGGENEADDQDKVTTPLPLESLSFSGIRAGDRGASWLWRRCANLRHLQLRACEGTGDDDPLLSADFICCLPGLQQLELRTCRTISGRILSQATEHCRKLNSLLLYDGCSGDALLHFISSHKAALSAIDLRLPLDLDNGHILAIASEGQGIASLRLQSCCLVTGDGLRSLASTPVGATIEELALVNCDVVEREPGLLTLIGQNMCRLRTLDLSHNEMLCDKEMRSVLASCANLLDIRLKGCRALTDAVIFSLLKCCGERLRVVDISQLPGISVYAVEVLILNARSLRRVIVEECKVSESSRDWISRNGLIIG